MSRPQAAVEEDSEPLVAGVAAPSRVKPTVRVVFCAGACLVVVAFSLSFMGKITLHVEKADPVAVVAKFNDVPGVCECYWIDRKKECATEQKPCYQKCYEANQDSFCKFDDKKGSTGLSFSTWVRDFKMSALDNDGPDRRLAHARWLANDDAINKLNSAGSSAKFSHNAFSAMDWGMFKETMLMPAEPAPGKLRKLHPTSCEFPDSSGEDYASGQTMFEFLHVQESTRCHKWLHGTTPQHKDWSTDLCTRHKSLKITDHFSDRHPSTLRGCMYSCWEVKCAYFTFEWTQEHAVNGPARDVTTGTCSISDGQSHWERVEESPYQGADSYQCNFGQKRQCTQNVRSQGKAGTCWANAAAAAIDYHFCINNLPFTKPVSVQQLVDCTVGQTNHKAGACGGQTWFAFLWAKDHELVTEDSYPYVEWSKDDDDLCPIDTRRPDASRCTQQQVEPSRTPFGGIVSVPRNSEALKNALMAGPVTVNVNVNFGNWHLIGHYESGILDLSVEDALVLDKAGNPEHGAHAMLIVGYSDKGPKGFWKIQNSWGSAWGDQGFLHVAQNRLFWDEQKFHARSLIYPDIKGH